MLGAKLAQFRNAVGMTQPELSIQSGVALRTISGMEAGELTNPTLQTLKALARTLNVTIAELVADAEVATSP